MDSEDGSTACHRGKDLRPGSRSAHEDDGADSGPRYVGQKEIQSLLPGERIPGYLLQSLRTGAKQEVIEDLLVLQRQLGELVRQSEDHVNVGDRQKFVLASRDPLVASAALALGAMAIAAAVKGDGAIATARALVAMSAEGCGTAAGDGPEHFAVGPVNPAAVVLDEAIALCANDIEIGRAGV